MFCVMVLESRMEMGIIALAGERCRSRRAGGCSHQSKLVTGNIM